MKKIHLLVNRKVVH